MGIFSGEHRDFLEDYRGKGELKASQKRHKLDARYKIRDLVDVTRQQCQGPMNERLNDEALHYFSLPVAEVNCAADLRELIYIWTDIFDQAFFFNSIRKVNGRPVFRTLPDTDLINIVYAAFKNGHSGGGKSLPCNFGINHQSIIQAIWDNGKFAQCCMRGVMRFCRFAGVNVIYA
jgi:hypothetical protein